MYNSGDKGRFLMDGNLEFLGRRDDQVKINGVRVELGEVEAALRDHPKITDCSVICWKAADQANRLVAFVVMDPKSTPDPWALRLYLADILPSYLLPSEFQFRKSLPVTPNGKTDKSALTPAQNSEIPESYSLTTRNAIESEILEIWVDLLGHDRLGINDHFFQVGGHSLLAMRLIARLNSRFHIEISLRFFLEMPTIAALAKMVESLLSLTQKPVSIPEGYETGEI